MNFSLDVVFEGWYKSISLTLCRVLKCLLFITLFFPVNEVFANIPFRVSIKFIVDANGNRPLFGNFNTTDEVNAEINSGNAILKAMLSELRIQVTEIVDLPISLSIYSKTVVNEANKNTIRNLAIANPVAWKWRTNAINIYVTGGAGSAYSSFPPINDVVLFGQNCSNTPSCLLHELGHSFNLFHTHADDSCSDTLNDNSSWINKDQMAVNNYGQIYNLLTGVQKNNVDMTWSNFMSYHVNFPQDRFTPCQKDRASSQASIDQAKLLSKFPLYVHPGNAFFCSFLGSCNGSWGRPFKNLQHALNSNIVGKSIVLEKGRYLITQNTGINSNIDIVSRQGRSDIDRGALLYELPVGIDHTNNPELNNELTAVQREASLARKVLSDDEKNAAVGKSDNLGAIKKRAIEKHKQHKANIINHFLTAEKYAAGNEKLAIQMELAQRYWHSHNYPLCLNYYTRVAEHTDQFHLREKAFLHARQCQSKMQANIETSF